MPRAVLVHKEGPYQDLKLEDVPALKPAPGNVVVRVLSCGLAFPDVLTVLGKHIMRKPVPFVPGNEVSGEITAVGEGVTGLRVGDRVFGTSIRGGLSDEAEIMAAMASPLPEGVDPDVAAGFELNYGTTYHGLIDIGHLAAGETLLVLGASGGVGAAAIDIGKAVGATVIACASSQEKLDFCKAAGADHVINYESSDLRAELKKLKKDGAIDVVYDPVGGKWSEQALRAMGWGGRFLVVGFASGGQVPKDAIPSIPLNLALLNERKILGVFWGPWKARTGNKGNDKNLATMLQWVKEGKLKPIVSRVYPLDESFKSAFDDMMNRKVMGKICLRPLPTTGASKL
mmetsp:Transcript_28836/g.73104  ORF Transcript_28836/g.73104 Transcript_28836/m.73104 type:complete len:343 (+) Transcript_28836:76-1104(+)|eukprot:CAMPEP_0195067318 /NCGR_PEP_ID=MMETSP0448-20130528/12413_1 /TAXON_ID=66468 /ORGANISM="Heterocapsa triquestra, Strain CCMP 448" /LENGTH=342 /DNA_ID=CAMNT_0040098715 /DNA_START=73 /DNA_END=1101 /DNA_ORIENTATION=+